MIKLFVRIFLEKVIHCVTETLALMLPGKDIFIMAKQLIQVPCEYPVMAFLSITSEPSR